MFACGGRWKWLNFIEMISGKFHLLRFAGLWAMTAASLFAGNFVAPAEGPVAFRRDKIPLDAETMAGLSRHLVSLARGLDAQRPVDRRAAAQMLALAIALDPGNGQARNVVAEFEAGNHQVDGDPEHLERSRTRIWHYLSWLETPEAGSDGRALAACLADVMVISDPKHPKVEELLAKGELGAWKDWIAGITAFEPVVVPEVAAPEKPAKSTVVGSSILLEKAQVSTVMWRSTAMGDSVKWEQHVAPLQMVARVRPNPEGEPRPFSISIGAADGEGAFWELGRTIGNLLKTQYGQLPAGGRVTITSKDLAQHLPQSRKQSISAAAAVLASAAVSGREPDATIIGVIDQTGAYKLPGRFWSQLQALGSGTGGRLILPTAAADYLLSILALERPQLFLDYEILLASNFQELQALSAKNPDEALAKSMASFREIREKAGGQLLGQYVANPFVRKRLVEIVQASPSHFSARMLAIQGAGNRPTQVTRNVLAAELRRAIEPMDRIVARQDFDMFSGELGRLGPAYELCREQVDRLLRYTSKDDRALVASVQEMLTGIRALERSARARGEDYDMQSEVYQAFSKLRETYGNVVTELAIATGDPEPGLSD